MRTRDLKPAFFRDLELTKLPPITRILYQGLWCRADKKGRQEDIAALIKADIFPLENVPVEKHLKQLADGGFIERYEVDGKRFIWIPKFLKHQHPHPKEPDSVLPEAPGEAGVSNDPITAEPLLFPESPGNPGTDPSHTLSSNTLTPNTLATALPATDALTFKMPFPDDEIEGMLRDFPSVNVNARWREFVVWIEGGGARERPTNLLEAFRGFLKRPARRVKEDKAIYVVN